MARVKTGMTTRSRHKKVLLKFKEALQDYGTVEKAPKLEGRNMTMFVVPKVG